MGAETHAGVVTVEERRKDAQRQSSRSEEFVAAQGGEDDLAHGAVGRGVLRHLQVLLGLGGLRPGGDAAIRPIGRAQAVAHLRDFPRRQQIGHLDQHGYSLYPSEKVKVRPAAGVARLPNDWE